VGVAAYMIRAISIDHGWFLDPEGRRLLLRGVNLGGSSKVPRTPDGATYRPDSLRDPRHVSFVGRPFPLPEADEHFERLRAWGLTLLRLLVPWEAVEHAGPGTYDEAYLDYLAAVVAKAGDYGFRVFVDPHQDVWSRFSGGDGAPCWTLEAAGFNVARLAETGAALTHQAHGDPLPRMIWPTNNFKLAAATMFTLFFAGNDFAPRRTVEGKAIGSYLQGHYIAAMAAVARRLKDLPAVIGYDTLNEPYPGYIGWRDLSRLEGAPRLGPMPTPFQSMLLGAGLPQDVDVWTLGATGMRRTGRRRLDPAGARAWLPGHDCPWREHGVWDLDSTGNPRLLRPDYFRHARGREVDFHRDFLLPFLRDYASAIRREDARALIFVETTPDHPLPGWPAEDPSGMVAAPHWYDTPVLMLKSFHPWLGYDVTRGRIVIGPWAIRRAYAARMRELRRHASGEMNGAPCVIGEVGIPFDLDRKRAYRTGDFSTAVRAMDRSLRAMDDALVSYTLWNYTADNSNARGDQWNDEDLSIFSRDQQRNPADIHSGGRALEAVVRPYARATAGEPQRMRYDVRRRRLTYEFLHDPAVPAPTEIFVPQLVYPRGVEVEVSDGEWELDERGECLRYQPASRGGRHRIVIRPRGMRQAGSG
jgi:hypothetical protein